MSIDAKLAQRVQALRDGCAECAAKQHEQGKLTARERIALLLDADSFVEWDMLAAGGVVTGFGAVDARPVYVYAQDVTQASGAMGMAQARKIAKVLDMAAKTGAPVVALLDSMGAKLEEGAQVLGAYADVYARHTRLSGCVPQIALILGPCVGAAALVPPLCDFVVAGGKSARLLAAAPQVVLAKTGKEAASVGGGEALALAGKVDVYVQDEAAAVQTAKKLLALLPANCQEDAPCQWLEQIDASMAADTGAEALAAALCDEPPCVLKAAFAPEAYTAIGTIGGRAVGILGISGMLGGKALGKAARFLRVCDAFGLPVVTLCGAAELDIADCCVTAQAAKLAYACAEASVGKVTVVTGQAIGAVGAMLGLKASADVVYAWPQAVIAPLDGAAASVVFFGEDVARADDPVQAREDFAQRYAQQCDALAAGEKALVDDVIEPMQTRKAVIQALETLSGKREARLPKKHGNIPL